MLAVNTHSLGRTEHECHRSPVSDHSLPSETPFCINSVVVSDLTYLRDHRIAGNVIYPAAGYSLAGIAVHQSLQGFRHIQKPITLRDLKFNRALPLTDQDSIVLRLNYEPSKHEFTVDSRRLDESRPVIRHAVGRLTQTATTPVTPNIELDKLLEQCCESINVTDFYRRLRLSGLDYGPFFKRINWIRASRHTSEAITRLAVHPELAANNDQWAQPITILDAAFQSLAAALGVDKYSLYVPSRIQTLHIYDDFQPDLWCYARLVGSHSRIVDGDITLFSNDGSPLVKICGLRCLRISHKRVARANHAVERQKIKMPQQNYFYR